LAKLVYSQLRFIPVKGYRLKTVMEKGHKVDSKKCIELPGAPSQWSHADSAYFPSNHARQHMHEELPSRDAHLKFGVREVN
jgi:hypothetical protein